MALARPRLTDTCKDRNVGAVGPTGGSPLEGCIKHRRDAFWRYTDAAGQRWNVKITPRTQQADSRHVVSAPGVRIELAVDDAESLAEILVAAAEQVKGGGPLAPGSLDTIDVAGRIGVQPATIRGWLARGGPKGNPFPRPDQRVHRRAYWRKATIDAWLSNRDRQRSAARADQQPRRRTASSGTRRQRGVSPGGGAATGG